MTFLTMAVVVEDGIDDHSAGLSVIMEEESCASSIFTEPAEDIGSVALVEPTGVTCDSSNQADRDEQLPRKSTGENHKSTRPTQIQIPAAGTKGTITKLFEYKKKLAIVWKRLEKTERRLLMEHDRNFKVLPPPPSPPPLPTEDAPGIPVRITVETKDACVPPAEESPIRKSPPGEIMESDEEPELNVEGPDSPVPDDSSLQDTTSVRDASTDRKDVLEFMLDSLGVDKMCGLDDEVVLEAAIATHPHRQRLRPPSFVVPVSSPLPLTGSPPDDAVLVIPTSSGKEYRTSQEKLVHRALFWSNKLVRHKQKERRHLMIQASSSSFLTVDPFRNEFDDEDDAMEVFDQLASLCDPLEFKSDD
mmetsp:Transcript_18834/g.52623  ORF Transcript_18834/g.52623 Transcript_18834/m.52623 type:complete len:361 (-) Transcript_18834:474-1556(-)